MAALSFSGAAVVERTVTRDRGRGQRSWAPTSTPLPLVEIEPKGGVYDYAARYTAGATEYFAPARLVGTDGGGSLERSGGAAAALGLRDLTRVDLIVDDEGALGPGGRTSPPA